MLEALFSKILRKSLRFLYKSSYFPVYQEIRSKKMFEEESDPEYASIVIIEEAHKQLINQIKEISEERDALKLITQKQLKNINELQEKCEESYIAISQLPENRNTASDRYEEAITGITKLQNKQFEINELLNMSLKEFDDTMNLNNNAKQYFSSEINVANQRLLIYQSNLKEINELGEKNITNLKESITAKSVLLQTVKQQTDSINISLISLQEELKQLTEKISEMTLINNDLKQQHMEIEEDVKKADENIQSLENCMASKQEKLNKKLESLKTELEATDNCKQELQFEMIDVGNNIEHQKNESILLKNKLDEAKMLSNNLKSSLESKKTEFHAVQNEMERRKMEISDLKNVIKEIVQVRTKCTTKETHVQKLMEEKATLVSNCSSLADELKIINEKIDNDKSKYNTIMSENEEVNNNIISINTKADQQQRELDELKISLEGKINSLSASVKEQTDHNLKLTESIKEKEEVINNKKKTLLSLESELEHKKALLKKNEEKNTTTELELTKKVQDAKEKKENLLMELQKKKEAINERKTINETIKTIREKIAFEKEKYDILTKTYEKEKEQLKASNNKLLEQKILDLQTLRMEKTKQWEVVRDSASKSEFTYYTVKSQVQRLREEVSCLNENMKTYSCENEMLKMLSGWITMNNDVSDTSSIQSKCQENPGTNHEVPGYSKSDSSFDEGTENEQEELIIQKYQMSRVRVLSPTRNQFAHYAISERPILISTDVLEGPQINSNQCDGNTSLENQNERNGSINDTSFEVPNPASYNSTVFFQDQGKKNAERKPAKHKIQDMDVINVSSSEDVKMKKPKAPQKKVLTKRANAKAKKKVNVPAKKKTILDLVIDSSN